MHVVQLYWTERADDTCLVNFHVPCELLLIVNFMFTKFTPKKDRALRHAMFTGEMGFQRAFVFIRNFTDFTVIQIIQYKSLLFSYVQIGHCAFSNVSSNRLPERMQNHTGCICLTFFHCVFLNVSSNCLPKKMHSRIGYICLTFPCCLSLLFVIIFLD